MAFLALLTLAVGGCVSGSTTSPSTNGGGSGSAAGSSPVKSTASPATGADGSGSRARTTSGYFGQMEQETAQAALTTFKATYSASDHTTVVYAQMGANSSFTAGSTGYYSIGASDTVCDNGNATPVCYTDAQPLQGVLSLVEPARASSAIRAAASGGASVTHTTESHGVQCLSYSLGGEQVKYCINRQGIVSYIGVPSGNFQLTQYTTDVSQADVSVPPNASTNPS